MDKEQIIKKTLIIAQKKGWEKTSIREISREIGYSTIKIYSDFGGKEGLLKEIQKKGFSQLKKSYIEAINLEENVKIQIINLTVAHFYFARNNSQLYELMFSLNNAQSTSPDVELLKDTGEPIRNILAQLDGKLLKHRFYHWWSIAHGFHAITMNSKNPNHQDNEDLLRKIMKDFIEN